MRGPTRSSGVVRKRLSTDPAQAAWRGPRTGSGAMTTAAVLAGGVAAAAVVVATSPHGPALSPDSFIYLSTGNALEHGRGFRNYTGAPLTDFPPGYPLALAAWLETVGGRSFD